MFRCKNCIEKDKQINDLENKILFLETLLDSYKNKNLNLEKNAGEFIKWQKKGKPKLDLDLDLIMHLIVNGKTVTEVANKFNVSRMTIYNRIKEYEKKNIK